MAKPTINDVARIAGVSKKTVSRVINQSPLLNEVTRAKVEQVIADLGYVPNPQARALALRRSAPGDPATGIDTADLSPVVPAAERKLIALLHDDGAMPFLPLVLHSIQKVLQGTGFALAVLHLDETDAQTQARAFLEAHRPFGAIVLAPLSRDGDALADLCREPGCRHIRLGARPTGEADVVASEDREASAMATGYLISLGHQRIGVVTGPEESQVAQERELGYLDAMADHDLDRGPALIANGDFTFASGLAAGQLLLEVSPRPTAILAGNDEMAAGVIHAAAQKGIKVPEALSVIGFEDTPIAARIWPPLTTVRVPYAEMARAAALALVAANAQANQTTAFKPQLVPRASAGPASRQT